MAPVRHLRRAGVAALATVLALLGQGLVASPIAAAAEVNLTNAVVAPQRGASVDVLPTVQINGVVWATEIVGNTVFAGGQFTSARPAGAAPGTDEVPRANFLAFDLQTGELIRHIDPIFNGRVNDIAASADGSTIYVAGSFSNVDGSNRYRLVALDAATGEVKTSFRPAFNATVNAVTVLGDVVYAGGIFNRLGSAERIRLAAVDANNGATLSWAPTADATVQGLAATPDGSRIVVAGSFSTLNGVQARGIGAVTSGDASVLPFPANQVFQNYGSKSSNYDLWMDADGTVYGSGYAYGTTNRQFFEGAFAVNAYSGAVTWLADCHGDTYSVARLGDTVYSASHHHHCSNIGGFPDTEPRVFHQHLNAFTVESTGLVRQNNQSGYPNFGGQPATSLVQWFPRTEVGTFTGQGQSAWKLAANDQYLVAGGEFPRINGVPQQGLARFAVRELAPNLMGPVLSPDEMPLRVTALSNTQTNLTWPANWDRDDLTLTYRVYREDVATPVCETTGESVFWELPSLSCRDTSVTNGAAYRYRVEAVDPSGNAVSSSWVDFTMPDSIHPYQTSVVESGPKHYWRMSTTGTITDLAGRGLLTTVGGVTTRPDGAIADEAAASFNGASGTTAYSPFAEPGPDTFTLEAWFNTTSSWGGKIIGLGSSQTGNSGSYDRQIYLANDGRVFFGVYPGVVRTINSAPGFNDGQWHHVAATMSSEGMVLYVDGKRVASRADTTTGQAYSGYWRVGGDSTSGWSSSPSSPYLNGSIDEVAVYDRALAQSELIAHYAASGRTAAVPGVPADVYGAGVYQREPVLFWRMDDSSGSTAADAGIGQLTGTYRNSPALNQQPIVQGQAVRFDGFNDTLGSDTNFMTPLTYSHELWFSTTSTSGGRLVGLGSSTSGTSSTYDRQVSMDGNGKLTFGSQGGSLTTPKSYNDGLPHHLVAVQAADGMQLYVDGELVASNESVTTNRYLAYLRVGGDGSVRFGRNYLQVTVDEVAFYATALDAAQVRADYRASGIAQNQPPAGDFAVSCDDAGVCTFTADATDPDGTVASYQWAFGDGQTGEGTSVSHGYAVAGSYQVELTITDDQGATAVVTKQVDVEFNLPPQVVFAYTCDDLACSFDSAGTTDPDGLIAAYTWEFGDESTADGPTATHTFAEGGAYEVTLTVLDDKGAISTATQTVTVVANQAPVPLIEVNCLDLTCQLSALSSHDADGSIVSYAWDLGDGTTSDQPTLSHSYAAAGIHQVTLTVTDDDGATGSVTVPVNPLAPNQVPTASFAATTEGLLVNVDATGSSDLDGTIVGYDWQFGDGASGTGATTQHQYAAAGEYTVTLTVTDDRGGTATTTTTVTIEAPANQPPSASFTVSVTDLAIAVDASASSDPEGPISDWSWDFGDGATGSGVTASHAYAAAGSYQVTLTVTDGQGATTSMTSEVQVSEPVNLAPLAEFTSVISDLEVALDASASSDPDGTIASYAWDFGDGATGTGAVTTHAYDQAGTYQITLTITDDRGDSATASQEVTVTAPPAVIDTVLARDSFSRTGSGWGTADLGGAWTLVTGASRFSTDGQNGVITLPTPGTTVEARLAGISVQDVQFDADFMLEAQPTGNGLQQTFIVRRVDSANDYRFTVRVGSDNLVRVNLTVRAGGATRSLGDRLVSGLVYQPGEVLHISISAVGDGTTTLTGYVWRDGDPRPATPAFTATDDSPSLQAPGAVGMRGYLTGSSAAGVAVVARIDNVLVTNLEAGTP